MSKYPNVHSANDLGNSISHQMMHSLCNSLTSWSPSLDDLNERVGRGSAAGTRSLEEAFTLELLLPKIIEVLEDQDGLILSTEDIISGIGEEHFRNTAQASFSPGVGAPMFFGYKKDFSSPRAPAHWYKDSLLKVNPMRSCPDIAFRDPLPRMVGDVKFLKKNECEGLQSCINKLWSSLQEVIFYRGVFAPRYQFGLLIWVDGTGTKQLNRALELINPEILSRFGEETGVFLAKITLSK